MKSRWISFALLAIFASSCSTSSCPTFYKDLTQGLEASEKQGKSQLLLISSVGCSDCTAEYWFYSCDKKNIDNSQYVWTNVRVDHTEFKTSALDSLGIEYSTQPRLYLISPNGQTIIGPQFYAKTEELESFVLRALHTDKL